MKMKPTYTIYGLCYPGANLFYVGLTINLEQRLLHHGYLSNPIYWTPQFKRRMQIITETSRNPDSLNVLIFFRTKNRALAFNEERRLIKLFADSLTNTNHSPMGMKSRGILRRKIAELRNAWKS